MLEGECQRGLAGAAGIEPASFGFGGRYVAVDTTPLEAGIFSWQGHSDSNRDSQDLESSRLANYQTCPCENLVAPLALESSCSAFQTVTLPYMLRSHFNYM